MRKVLKGMFVLAAVAAVQMGVSAVDASAATIALKDITVDHENQQLKITESSDSKDNQIYVSTATVKNVKTKGSDVVSKVLTAKTWDTYDYKAGMAIDLSTLNRAKDNYIQVKGNRFSDPVTIKIPAINSKVNAKFDAINVKVTMNDITNKTAPVAISDVIEYRTQYSNWSTYTAGTTDLTPFQQTGAKLYFRIAATANTKLSAAAVVKNDVVDADKAAMTVYQVGSFPGKELKVAITKRANAPKIAVNYITRQFTIPKNAQYRINTMAKLGTWSDAMTVATKIDAPETAGVIELRVAATTVKAASKSATLDFVARETIVAKSSNTNANKTPAARLAYDISANSIANAITVEYNSKVALGKTVYTGIKLTNATTDVYQVVIADEGTYTAASLPAATVSAKTVAAATSVGGTVTPKTTTIALKDGQQVFIRKMGVAKNQTWSTDFVGLGTVKFPVEAAE